MGCPKVLINGIPAAKMGDMVSEAAGPPNVITAGDPTVLICEGAGGVGGLIMEGAGSAPSSLADGGPSAMKEKMEGEFAAERQNEEMSYIKGQLLNDETSEPLESIPVTITGQDGKQYQTITDKQGYYEVRNIRKGKYQIVIDLEGQEDVKAEVEV
jgi:uncharacterized Zn-binding protein involved in type VI secretion